jgi:hypothetical protein
MEAAVGFVSRAQGSADEETRPNELRTDMHREVSREDSEPSNDGTSS